MVATFIAAFVLGGQAMQVPDGIGKDSLRSWVDMAILGQKPPVGKLVVLRQDHAFPTIGRSVMGTPLSPGGRKCQQGIGTHSNSHLETPLPPGAVRFKAVCGIDHNYDTQGQRGSVVFAVKADGKELFRSSACKGNTPPVEVDVPLPKGAEVLSLIVEDAGDGPAYDQSDWGDPVVELRNGSTIELGSMQLTPALEHAALPFSFAVGDQPADLSKWSKEVASKEDADGRLDTVVWTDSVTGLQAKLVVKSFAKFDAVDWVLHLANTGKQDTPILANVMAADLLMGRAGGLRMATTVRTLRGDDCSIYSFTPTEYLVRQGQTVYLAPTQGRSVDTSAFPFFSVQAGGSEFVMAIGWTGQWFADFSRDSKGMTRFAAGMEGTRLVLHPGESIRTPRILVLASEKGEVDTLNEFRRLIWHCYTPKRGGQQVISPIVQQCFDRYVARVPEWATEKGQLQGVEAAAKIGMDAYWFDAAWFPGNFPNGVGNHFHKTDAFPNGLKPVSDACHAKGMDFVMWFEPERAAPGTAVAVEHPEWVSGNLFRLDIPEAREWLTNHIDRLITDYGVDWYRQDFNMAPLPVWKQLDPPDRQGMAQIRHVEGLYAMWDEWVRRHPNLKIDNCSSGGRRMDLEMVSRAAHLWRSDTGCAPGHADTSQAQTQALSRFLPVHSTATWSPSAYEVRSAATSGVAFESDYLSPDFSAKECRKAFEEVRENSPFFTGDFYALTTWSIKSDAFVAYQFDRPDLDAGIVLAFRRPACPVLGMEVGLSAIDTKAEYDVEFVDEQRRTKRRRMAGKKLADGIALQIPAKGASLLVRYKKR